MLSIGAKVEEILCGDEGIRVCYPLVCGVGQGHPVAGGVADGLLCEGAVAHRVGYAPVYVGMCVCMYVFMYVFM